MMHPLSDAKVLLTMLGNGSRGSGRDQGPMRTAPKGWSGGRE
jgi:hypothetical protein